MSASRGATIAVAPRTPVKRTPRKFCRSGKHEMTPENTAIRHRADGTTHRACKKCARTSSRARYRARPGSSHHFNVEWIDPAPFVAWFDEQVAAELQAAGGVRWGSGAPQRRVSEMCGWPQGTGDRRISRWRHGERVTLYDVEAALTSAGVALGSIYPEQGPQDPGVVFDRWCYTCADRGHEQPTVTDTSLLCPWCSSVTGIYPPITEEATLEETTKLLQSAIEVGVKVIHNRSHEHAEIRQVYRKDKMVLILYDTDARPTRVYLSFHDVCAYFKRVKT